MDASYTLTAEEKRKLEEEEEEKRVMQQRSQGTPVTVETFMQWRSEFEAEMKLASAKSKPTCCTNFLSILLLSNSQNQSDPRFLRPTGKQLFLEHPTDFEEEEMDFEDDDDGEIILCGALNFALIDDEEWTTHYLEENADS